VSANSRKGLVDGRGGSLAYPDRVRVWLNGWEWECCGDDFKVGSEIEWDVMPLQREEWPHLELLGEDRLDTITHYTAPDDHIGDEERLRAVRIRGRVESVSAVYVPDRPRRYRWRRRSDQPALGTAVLKARDGPDFARWSDPDLVGPRGFIVELFPVD
jgi:hypothetical protein